MLSKSAQIAILKSVSLFAEIPEDTLDQVAALLHPLELRAGETIFHKGEAGASMYIITQGRVRVHDGEMLLNYLGTCDIFGEMAILDAPHVPQPRSASVTAVEDTSLLRLDQAAFHELMTGQAEISLGVMRVLNRRLRALIKNMAQDFAYMQQMARITAAAAALETGRYDPRSLDEVCQREDELGQLARVFQRMASEVVAREQRLQQEVQQLRIQIDEVQKKRQVAEITESEFFQDIQEKADELRARKK